jgi:hypothetical protein
MLRTVSIAAAAIALRASAKILAASAQESEEQLLKGRGAFGGWQQGKPRVRRLFTLQDLPPIVESTPNFSEVVPRPAGAKPQVPADLVASGLAESLAIRTAPNGDLFVADRSANVVRVFRVPAGSAKPARGAVFAGGLYQPYGITIYPLEPNPKWVYIAKCRARYIQTIPVDVVNRVVPELIRNGRVPALGIGIVAGSETIATRLGVEGVIVMRTTPGSPAARACLHGVDSSNGELGDIIVGANGRPVRGLADLAEEVEQTGVGKTIELTLKLGSDKISKKIEVTDVEIQATPAGLGIL